MDESIYEEIAKRHGLSVREVKREMQAAINEAYANPNSHAMAVPRKNAIPTVAEFIEYVLKRAN